MTTNKNNIVNAFIVLMLFFMDDCWHLSIFAINSTDVTSYSKFVSICIVLLYVYSRMLKNTPLSIGEFTVIWILFYLSLVISYTYGSYYVFKQSIFGLANMLFWFAGILLYFFLRALNHSIGAAKNLINLLVLYGFAASILSIYCSLFTPDIFTDSSIYTSETSVRFGFRRIPGFAENSVALAFCVSFFSVFDKMSQKTYASIVTLLITAFSLFFVTMSRQVIVPLFMLAIYYLLSNFRHSKKIRIFLFAVIFVGVAFSPFLFGYFNSLVNSIDYSSSSSLDAGSLEIRLLAINYYNELLGNTNGIGFGWFAVTNDDPSNIISYATNILNFRLVDLGIFSTLFMFGYFGVLVELLYILKIITLSRRSNHTMLRAIKFFIILKGLSLNYLFYWPSFSMYFALIAYAAEIFSRNDVDAGNVGKFGSQPRNSRGHRMKSGALG